MGELNDILHGLEPSLGPVGGEPAPLEGGITNRNFRVRARRREYVLRLHGKDTELLGIEPRGRARWRTPPPPGWGSRPRSRRASRAAS